MQIPNLRDKKRQSVRYKAQLRLRYNIYETKGQVYNNSGQQVIQEIKEGKTIDISSRGVFFETEDKPDLGKLCRIEILLPEDKNIKALGRIIKVFETNPLENKVNTKPQNAAFGRRVVVEFTKITQSNIDRICMWYYKNKIRSSFLQQVLERRKNKRLKIQQASLGFRKKQLLNWNKWNKARIVDVSPDGILYKIEENKVKINDPLLVKIYLPAYDNPIKGVGKVVRVKRNPLEFIDEVAVRLSKLKKEDRKKLIGHNYLDALVDRADTSLKWF